MARKEFAGGKEKKGGKAFFLFCLLGSLFLLLEVFLQLKGKSVCVSQGCRLTAGLTRFGDFYMVLFAFLSLAVLTLLAGLSLKGGSPGLNRLINLGLIAALAAEGFFVGYQMFWMPELCLFCLTVFGIVLLLGLVRWSSGEKAIGYGFAALALVFVLPAVVLPPPGKALPQDQEMILFYSDGCKYCEEIKKEIEKRKLAIPFVHIREYGRELKALGVDSVPTLLVNRRYEKHLLSGVENIRRFLDLLQSPAPGGSKPAVPSASLKKTTKGKGTPKAGLLPPKSSSLSPGSPFPAPSEQQACKQDERCD